MKILTIGVIVIIAGWFAMGFFGTGFSSVDSDCMEKIANNYCLKYGCEVNGVVNSWAFGNIFYVINDKERTEIMKSFTNEEIENCEKPISWLSSTQ